MKSIPIRGATVVVCGASRGLGRALALDFARQGAAKIAICARSMPDLEDVAGLLRAKGVEVHAEACDLACEDEARAFLGDVEERFGPIDVLVTNAATITVAPAESLTTDDFEEAMRSIFHSALNPILAVMPRMRERRRGTIAVVTSIGGRVGVPHLAPYCAAKFATMGLSESLRAELAQDGVHLMTVVPGLMRTGSNINAQFKGDQEKEYTWFGAGATAPLVSIDADRAAHRIVRGIAKGRVEVAFTPEARFAPILRAVAPALWATLLQLTARFLLPKGQAGARRSGTAVEKGSTSAGVRYVRRRSAPYALRHGQLGRA